MNLTPKCHKVTTMASYANHANPHPVAMKSAVAAAPAGTHTGVPKCVVGRSGTQDIATAVITVGAFTHTSLLQSFRQGTKLVTSKDNVSIAVNA